MLLDQSPPTSEIEWLCVDADGYKIVNVYKPPPTLLRTLDLPVFSQPCLYTGDFNCLHVDWGYDDNSPDDKCFAGWESINCLALLYNAKDAASFYSGRWNTGTNSDLTFISVGPNNRLADKRILEKFHVDAVYQDFYNIIKKAAKKVIPRGYQNNYAPCWDAECEFLYRTFLQSFQGDESSLAATALLAKLNRKWKDQWSEAVRSIDLSQSSRKAWSIYCRTTLQVGHDTLFISVPSQPYSYASQLIRNGRYETVDRRSSRLVFQEVSDLWRATTLNAVNISNTFF